MPWARSFWAFSPYLNHMRKFSKRENKKRIANLMMKYAILLNIISSSDELNTQKLEISP
jgi:hypothetical protein